MTGTSSPRSTSSARSSLRAAQSRVRRVGAAPQSEPDLGLAARAPAGRGRGSATGAGGGPARARARDRPGARPGRAARRGRSTRRLPSRRAMPRIPASASASRTARDLVRRPPVPVDGARAARRPWPTWGRRAGSARGAQSTRSRWSTNVPGSWAERAPVPGEAVPRQLGRGQDGEALVVGLEQRPLLVEQRVRPGPSVPGDPGERTRSWFRPATSSGSNWSEPSRSTTVITPGPPAASAAARGSDEWRGTDERSRGRPRGGGHAADGTQSISAAHPI